MHTKIDENGRPVGLPTNLPPEDESGDWYPMVMPPPRVSECQILVWELINGVCVGRWEGDADPLSKPACREEINAKHRELESSPVLVFGEPFDCDERSEIRMRDAIAFWDLRPLENGVFEEREFEGVLTKVIIWTKGDNSLVELTREQLQAIFNEMLAQRAIRGAILFANLRRFKDSPNTTLREISDLSNWGI